VKERLRSILAVLLVAVFVNFVFSNTVFTHTHKYGTYGTVTHSHPYLPSVPHGHASVDYTGFNVSASAFQAASFFDLPIPELYEVIIGVACLSVAVTGWEPVVLLRGPPAILLF
jgi:hypothetical protein